MQLIVHKNCSWSIMECLTKSSATWRKTLLSSSNCHLKPRRHTHSYRTAWKAMARSLMCQRSRRWIGRTCSTLWRDRMRQETWSFGLLTLLSSHGRFRPDTTPGERHDGPADQEGRQMVHRERSRRGAHCQRWRRSWGDGLVIACLYTLLNGWSLTCLIIWTMHPVTPWQILSNGKHRSVEHRAVVHPDRERISAAVFHRPCQDAQVGPLPELMKDGNTKARYRSVGYMEFMRRYYSAKLDGRNHLESMKIELWAPGDPRGFGLRCFERTCLERRRMNVK